MKGSFFIDSFTTLTPVSEFKEINDELTDLHYVVQSKTMEIKEEMTLPIFYTDEIGTKFRVSIVSLFGSKYVRITWTSKMLGAQYFDGLNMANFVFAFSALMVKIKCVIPFHDFLSSSKINDIDFTCDFMATQSEFESICGQYKNVSGTKRFYTLPGDYLSQKSLSGLQFVNRKDASISAPFIKFYTKKDELFTRSKKFYQYLLRKDVTVSENLRRLECTLKNSKHIENVFKKTNISLHKINVPAILSLPPAHISNVVNHLLSRYVGYEPPDELEISSYRNTTPTNHLLSAMASELLESGWSVKTILGLLDTLPSLSDTAKSRVKKRLGKELKAYRKLMKLKALKLTPTDAFEDRSTD